MRDHLARSLERLGELAGPVLGSEIDLGATAGHIRAHRVDPAVFARYYDLIFALQSDNHAAARRLWRGIAELAPAEASWRLLPFGTESLGEDAERFARLCAPTRDDGGLFGPPDADDWRLFAEDADGALDLLGEVCPAWTQEMQALVSRVVGAGRNGRGPGRGFGGASSFMIWGAVFINVTLHRGRTEILSGLAHEAAHQLLFALSREEPLVTNPPEARYRSPLRLDPRPMDGVFHATYLSARLSLLYQLLLESGRLTPFETGVANQRGKAARLAFHDGHGVVTAEAEMTPVGRQLMEEAADYAMAAA